MRYREILFERSFKDHFGNQYAVNPSPLQFRDIFSKTQGAAFWIDREGNVGFGGSAGGSIDHSTIAQNCQMGEEAARGFISSAGECQIEYWIQADDEESISEKDHKKLEIAVETATSNAVIRKISKSMTLLVFSYESGQPIIEKEI
jgi:hypothetical protein